MHSVNCLLLDGPAGPRRANVCLSSSVVVCRLSSAVSKTADIMTLSVSFRYGK